MSPADRNRTTRVSPRGFTLLEILLTLAMSVVLMALVNAAFKYYAVDMDVADTDMRQTMLAAAIVQMIEDDLRSTLHPEPMDMTALSEVLKNSAAAATGISGEQAVPEGTDLSAAGIESDSGDEELVEEEPLDAATLDTGAAILQTPGLIGNQYQIQIDTSRLPRLEEYMVLMDETVTDLEDVPSDLKTVTYFVQPAGTVGGVNDPMNQLDAGGTDEGGGLVRRSLDRNATVFAATNANFAQLNATGEILAPEVVGLEFSYWDGISWLLEWNSDQMGELPLAVQIQVTMVNTAAEAAGLDPTDQDSARVFQHIVRLPMAKVIEEEEEEDDAAMEEAGI